MVLNGVSGDAHAWLAGFFAVVGVNDLLDDDSNAPLSLELQSIRGVWQLKKITIQYCKHAGSSAGVRDYLRAGVVDFARDHPQVQIETSVRSGRHPVAKGEYVTGQMKVHPLRNEDPERIDELLTDLRNTSGRKLTKFDYTVKSETPSIQGVWRPNLPQPLESDIVHFFEEDGAGTAAGLGAANVET